MVPAANVVRLAVPPRAGVAFVHAALERQSVATAAQAWQLQFDFAWGYPRLCYALWSRLMTLDR